MAATASPRSEPPCRPALARFLARVSGAQAVAISALEPLRGGAIRQNWEVAACFSGGMLAGEQRLVLRTPGPSRFAESLAPEAEFAVLQAAFAAGVRVPEPLFAGSDAAVCARADVLVAAVGVPELIGAEYVKPGAAVIDVGMNRTEAGLRGDVEFGPVSERAGWLTPVPGGVGPMTIAMLLRNTVLAAEMQLAAAGRATEPAR